VVTKDSEKTTGYVFSYDRISLILIEWFDNEKMKILDQNKIGKKSIIFCDSIIEFNISKNACPAPIDLDKYEKIQQY
jgi:hypothetical protein